MRTMKVRKAKRVTKVASGKLAKSQVFRGRKEKTKSGLTREMLMKNKRGKVVSKGQSAAGKRKFHLIKNWVDAIMKTRASLGVRGFVAINGRTLVGKALYVKAKALCGKYSPSTTASAPATVARSNEQE